MIDTTQALFFFMRHCKTAANDENIYRAWSNAPLAQLSEEGRADVEEAAKFLKDNLVPISMVVCDSLDRTLETAEILCGKLDVERMTAVRKLHPLNLGDLTLKSKTQYPLDEYLKSPTKKIPGGESLEDFNRRQLVVFDHLFKLADDTPNGFLLIVGHGSNVSFLHNEVFNKEDKPIGYEGLVHAGGLIMADRDGLIPLTKIRGEGTTERLTAEDAEYMELAGAVKDADCKKVFVRGGVSKKLGCCDKFDPEDASVKNFRCGTCEYLTERRK